MIKSLFKFFLKSFLLFSWLYSQPVQIKTFNYENKKLLFDTGLYWDELSSIYSYRDKYSNSLKKEDYTLHSFLDNNLNKSIGFSANFFFKKYFYVYLNTSFLGDSSNGKNTRIESANFSGKGFTSGFGFENDWVTIQYGKGKESWGAGNDLELALSFDSAPYNYFFLHSNYGHLRVSYMHGFLEQTDEGIKRYINARGLEWANKKSVILSLTETIIYSGENRSLDFGYINPISSHLEVENNNRNNIYGTDYGNAVWQLHLDLLIKKKSRFSLNFLIDEFVLDPKVEIDKQHGRAYSFGYSYNILSDNNNIVNFFISNFYIGTPTFRHGRGENNFVHQNQPIGFNLGSDVENINTGLKYSRINKLLLVFTLSYINSGEESILDRPYEAFKNYEKSKFPSGKAKGIVLAETFAIFKLKNNLTVNILFDSSKNLNCLIKRKI